MQFITQPTPMSSEVIDDRVATVLEAGTNIILTYDDAVNVLKIDATPGGGGSTYTDEQAQDAVGNILQDSATIDYVYNDATPYITGLVKDNSITEAMLNLSDNTTKNSTISAHGLLPKLSGNTGTFLRGDGVWIVPPAGATYTDEQAQDAVGGILVDSATVNFTYNDATPSITADIILPTLAPTDAEYITSTTHATLSAERVLTDTATVTWDRTTAGQIKANAAGGMTTEQVQDIVAPMFPTSASIDFTYNDTAGTIAAEVRFGGVTENHLSFSDVTSDDATTGQHGLLPKLSGSSTQFLDGTGAWSTPAGAASYWTRTPGNGVVETSLIAYWRMEEASGNRVDSKNSIALVPTGTPGNAAGKNGQAIAFTTAATTYLSAVDSANLSVGVNQDFSVACWIYFNGVPTGARGIIGKGNASVSYNNCEYLLGTSSTNLIWYVRSANINAGITLAATTWYFVVAWYDATADIQYIQVNNGTPAQFANATGSFDSADPVEVGRQPQWTGSTPFDGRIDGLMFWKRVLTTDERTALYNSGNGVDYPFTPATLAPTTAGDQIVSLLALSDVPDAYTSNALKLLRVNAAANAVEFGDVLGTMATQNANAVAITDGTIALGGAGTGLAQISVRGNVEASDSAGLWVPVRIYPHSNSASATLMNGVRLEPPVNSGAGAITSYAGFTVNNPTVAIGTVFGVYSRIASGTNRYNIYAEGTAPNYFGGTIGLLVIPLSNAALYIHVNKEAMSALVIRNTVNDAGAYNTMSFQNVAAAQVGSINISATATAFNTSSDVRLKHAVATLTGALERMQALRPISFKWNADDSHGVGFLAHELQQIIPESVTGEPEAINDDGSIKPQQVDHSKLVPWLVAGMKELMAQVETLTARVAALEA